MCQKKTALIHQKHAYFSVLPSSYGGSHNFQDAWHHEDPEERKAGVRPSKTNSRV